jgi:hypothetical protein
MTLVNHSIVEGKFAMRRSRLVISLPLVIFAASLFKPLAAAEAAAMDAAQATQLLAKAQAANVKCQVLGADQSQGLKDLLARAEISLAEKSSVSVARKAIAAGRNEGKAVNCDAPSRKLVNDVYAAATTAVTAPVEDMTQVAAPEAMPEPQLADAAAAPADEPDTTALAVAEPPKPKKRMVAKPIKPAPKMATKAKPAKPRGGLNAYAGVAEKYYAALRCGNMGAGQLNQLYQVVLSNHAQAMASNRPGDVRAVLRKAEARAGAKTCS